MGVEIVTGNNLMITILVVIAVLTGIKAVDGGINVIKGWLNPASKTKAQEKLKRHDDLFAKDNQRLAELERFKEEQRKFNERFLEGQRMSNKALFAVLKHARTNNSTGLMDKTIDMLQEHLNET